ncbi:FAD-dependent oxidoreductase [candidate division KSB1 bacterium]|nr:FAD-dependent oxidoreductase [candidate division KSB1 bacterium]
MTAIEKHDVVVIGAGPAGMAAALGAKRAGVDDVLLLERDSVLGGILNQCIHDGFGLFLYEQTISGPEYAENLIDDIIKENVRYQTDAMVLDLTADRIVKVNSRKGYQLIQAGAVILAMGCRERTREMIEIPGARPAGIFTAGCAQNLVNLQNLKIGQHVLILGSGDIGLIMARRLTFEGMHVIGVHELMPFCNGLERNVRQCLLDFDIPLRLSSTVIDVQGRDRLESATVAAVDEQLLPILGTEETIACDTLLLSVGLIPENELSKKAGVCLSRITGGAEVDEYLMTSVDGIFSCGNVLHIHDVADFASFEGFKAGEFAAKYLNINLNGKQRFLTHPGKGIRYCLPQKLHAGVENIELNFRVTRPSRNKRVSVLGKNSGIRYAGKKFPRLLPSELMKIKIKKAVEEELEVICHD